jgi:hypothetical protein
MREISSGYRYLGYRYLSSMIIDKVLGMCMRKILYPVTIRVCLVAWMNADILTSPWLSKLFVVW